ncbi:hypothetical protein IFR04_012215 [Cadophora malorum]|uniref:Lysine-specific metallo-endopeptidase domain-containing protein n=1 Tax=Cadophora malorum TaxID=108018 RepID=A0A8H7W8C8_9HELO|nr:hypothetical protein IFR04_012215 [Cadophora malorum]
MNTSLICVGAIHALLFSLSAAAVWMVDPESCDVASGKYAFVQNAMRNALTIATAANNALQQTPRSTAVQSSLDLLFNNGDQTLVNTYGPLVFGNTHGITRLTAEATQGQALSTYDVKIYCDQKRIDSEWRGLVKVNYDNDIKQNLQEKDYSSCSLSTLMYTTTPNGLKSPHLQIQICPNFLLWALPIANPSTAWLSLDFWKKISASLVNQVTARFHPEIDAYSLFDVTMLHELTHASRRFSTIDVDNGGGAAYGWKKCRALSTTLSSDTGNQWADPGGPEINADSWALFGCVAWQLSTGRISGINADGSFIMV